MSEITRFNMDDDDSGVTSMVEADDGVFIFYTDHTAALEAVKATTAAPVAWRWRDNEFQTWNYIDFDPVHMDYVFVEPLYPQPHALGPEGFFDDPFEKSSDADTALQSSAREAGWALSTLVDEIKFEKRQQVVNIINRLSAALVSSALVPSPALEGNREIVEKLKAEHFDEIRWYKTKWVADQHFIETLLTNAMTWRGKYGNPNGTQYEQGAWDMAQRFVATFSPPTHDEVK